MWKNVYGSACAMNALAAQSPVAANAKVPLLVVAVAMLLEDLACFEQAHVVVAAVQVVAQPC